ncbi:HD domain-containing protein [Streptacidiphilus cavernicola]|uniref:HD domain-containing protein n=1 Tax=Streptacidiphilus cavernicola TaxID=3342716 RepID=A0ABV6VUA5_9ACTN
MSRPPRQRPSAPLRAPAPLGALPAVRVLHGAAAALCVALAVTEAGWWALPLFGAPLLLGQLSFRRHRAIRATRRETVASLARTTELAGYTLPGHARRVADLADRLGRDLGLRRRELRLLEYAALMHDIGQLSLVDPVPGGATALLPVEEQRRIGRLGSEVIRRAGVPAQVADIVAAIAEPSAAGPDGAPAGGPVPPSAIIRVANAFDDLDGDGGGPEGRLEVVRRLRADTGRGYEPRALEALARVCLSAAP